MPTYTQLNAEAVWRAETITDEMDWLGDQLCAALGVPRANFGVRGDNTSRHLRGGDRTAAWILNSRYCTSRTYTVEPGLPAQFLNDVPAFDITPKTNAQMLWICGNLDRVVRAGQLEEVVVWYGNLDNKGPVDGFDNIRNVIASSDRSHDWHAHVQLGRRFTRSRAVMERVLAALLGRPAPVSGANSLQGDDMPLLFLATIKGSNLVRLVDCFMTNRAVTAKGLATTQAALKGNGLGTSVWEWPDTPEYQELMGVNIDSLDDPVDVTLTPEQLASLGVQIQQGVPSLAQIRGVVDDEIDEAFRGGADDDSTPAG